MKANVLPYYSYKSPLYDIAVVIDVFRATSTIVTALAHGVKEIISCSSFTEALAKKAIYSDHATISAGEKDTRKHDAFDFGNSPIEFMNSNINNKTLILHTTNGTGAIRRCAGSKKIYTASLLNADAIAHQIISHKQNFTLVCSGSKGQFAIEDAICAGMILKNVIEDRKVELDDFAKSILWLYKSNHRGLLKIIRQGKSYQKLLNNNHKSDVNFCLQKNIYPLVPVASDSGVITVEKVSPRPLSGRGLG